MTCEVCGSELLDPIYPPTGEPDDLYFRCVECGWVTRFAEDAADDLEEGDKP
jgi:RNase P subunit RPR2